MVNRLVNLLLAMSFSVAAFGQTDYSLSKFYTLDKLDLGIEFQLMDYAMVYPGVLVSTPGQGILFHLEQPTWIEKPNEEEIVWSIETSKVDPTHIFALKENEYNEVSVWEYNLGSRPAVSEKVFQTEEILYSRFTADEQGKIAMSGLQDEIWVVLNHQGQIIFESDYPIVDLDFLMNGALVITRTSDILVLGDELQIILEATDMTLQNTDFFEQQIVTSTSQGIVQLTHKGELKTILEGLILNFTVSNGKLYTVDQNNDLLIISSYR